MKKYSWPVLLPVALLLFLAHARAQGSAPNSDPYRNFVGQWSGESLVDRDNLPAKVKIAVTEEKNGRAMRWDYVFGREGEKGFKRATKLIVFEPAKGRIRMHFVGSHDQIYLTSNLDRFVQDGMGQFSASACSPRGKCTICEFDLQPTSLSYRWKTTADGKTFDIYSEFVFKREATK